MKQKIIVTKEAQLKALTGLKLTTITAGYIDFASRGENHGKYHGNKWWGLSWRPNHYTSSNHAFVLKHEENAYDKALDAALKWAEENPEEFETVKAARV